MSGIAISEEQRSVFDQCGAEVMDCGLRFTDPDLPYEEMENLVRFLGRGTRWFGWAVGDALVAAEDLYGEVFAQLEHATGLAHQTLLNRRSIAASVPHSIRRPLVALSTHAEVAALTPNEQRHWLARAEKEQLSKMTLREMIQEARKPAIPPSGDDEDERADNGTPLVPLGAGSPRTALIGSLAHPKDAVLATIRDLRDHAEPLDEQRVAVLRDDLEALEAFLGEE